MSIVRRTAGVAPEHSGSLPVAVTSTSRSYDGTGTLNVYQLVTPVVDPVPTAFETRLVERARRRYARTATVRRLLDVAEASAALIITAPLMVAVAIAVRLTSRGAAIFRQNRVGRCGKSFECLKFRTMRVDAESQLAVILSRDEEARAAFEDDFKLDIDPRVTRIGRILRRSSLDELPQLINVLRGEMSMVGPRPVVPEELRRYGAFAQVVLQVRPGMTGQWQVGGRNATSYRERIHIDIDYALNHTLVSDFRILIRTVRCVLKPGSGESR